MQSKAPTIKAYIKTLAPRERSVIESLNEMVRTAHPHTLGVMKYGMPAYAIGGRLIGFNVQKHYFAFYADPEIVKQHLGELKGRDVGKCCIRFRKLEPDLLATIKKIVAAYSKCPNGI